MLRIQENFYMSVITIIYDTPNHFKAKNELQCKAYTEDNYEILQPLYNPA